MGRCSLLPSRKHSLCALTLLLLFAVLLFASMARAESGDAICYSLYPKSRGIPGTKGCSISVAGGTPVGMGSYFCTANLERIDRYCNAPEPVAPEASCPVADPIYPGTGVNTLAEADFVSGGDTPVTFRRTYRSVPHLHPDAGVGSGWFHNWQRQLDLANARASSPQVIAYREDGEPVTFVKTNGLWRGKGTASLALRDSTNGWTLTDLTSDTAESYSSAGVLLSVSTHDGRVTTLTYSDANTPSNVAPAAGLLIAVTEHAADTSTYVDLVLRFSYDAKYRITQMTDPTGAITRYGYDANNNLISVTWPDGYVRRYLYEDARFWSAMTGVIDETGSRVATWTYDAKGRAVAASHPDTTRNVQFGYGANSTTVTDSRRTTTLNFSSIAGVQRPAGSSSSLGNTATTWDANGNLLTDSAADGSGTEYSYDDIGRPTRVARQTSMGLSVTTVRYADATTLHPSLIAMPRMMRGFAYDEWGNLVGLSELSTDDVTGASGFDAKSTGEQRTYGFAYDSRNRLTDTLTMVGGQTVEHWHQTYDWSANRRTTMLLGSGRAVGIGLRDAAHRPLDLMDDGMDAYVVYDVRGRVTKFTYVEHPAPSNGKVSRTLTVDYTYSPDGRVVSRTGTVKPDGGSAVAIGRDEIDEWLDNYESGVTPAGPAVGTFKLLKALGFTQEPGLEPICVECFIPGTGSAAKLINWIVTITGEISRACKPAVTDISAINWGKNPSQIAHTYRHLDAKGIPREPVTTAIREDIATNAGARLAIDEGQSFYISVDGITIEYSAHRLSATEIRVGSIRPLSR
jgi:YD repeat-containing protein